MRRHISTALAVACALGVAACGSSPTDTRTPAATPPQATAAASSTPAKTPASKKRATKKTATQRSAAESGCMRKPGAVIVSLVNYPHIADHVRDAIHSGQPVILHIDRAHADEHRAVSTDDLPTKRGYDRDEYPPAMSREGGENADVRYVKSGENRAAGASMGGQLRGYCNGQKFQLTVGHAPKPAKAKPVATATAEALDTDVGKTADDASISYANCTAARAAGAAPLTADDPGYAAHLDRDGDGVACEN